MHFYRALTFLFIFLLAGCSHTVVERVEGPPAVGCPVAAAADVLKLTNAYRKEEDRGALTRSAALVKAAEAHARWMVKEDTLSHEGDQDSTPKTRAEKAGYTAIHVIGENIADGQGTAKQVMRSWKNSSAHNEILLNKDVKDIGIACYAGDNGRPYWAMLVAVKL